MCYVLYKRFKDPFEDKHWYEENLSFPPSDGVEDGRPHTQADENNYIDLSQVFLYV